jgi:hypothetical protein
MDIDHETQNRWFLGGHVPGVHFSMGQRVLVVAGPYRDITGVLISIYSLGPDPLFHLETSDGGDVRARQSELAPIPR